MTLTSRQRFLRVLNGQMPDRVPVTLFIQDQGHYINQLYPEIDPWDSLAIQLKIIEYQRQLGADVFVRLLFGMYPSIQLRFGGLDVDQQNENWEVHDEWRGSENTRVRRSTIRTPAGTLEQEFSIHEIRPGTFLFGCTRKPIRTLVDLEIAEKYEPRMPNTFPAFIKEQIRPVRQALGEAGILGVWSPNGPFNVASRLVDESDLYALFITEPEFYQRLMNFSIERVADYTRAIDAAGVDVHIIGGNVASGFLGRRNYDRYILAFEKKYIDIVQANGTPAIYHNCGQIMNLVESYKSLGVRVVEPFSPPPKLGDADLRRVKDQVKGAYIVIGGVDQVLVIQQGTREQVRQATAETIRIGKPGGGYIIQNADFLEYGTPPENVETFVKTALCDAEYN